MTTAATQEWTLIGRTANGMDSYGNDVFVETSTPIEVVFAPGGSSEITDAADQVITEPTLYGVPASVDVTAIDAVEAPDGTRYEVVGDPQGGYQSPFTSWQPGLVLHLKRVTG